MRLTLATRNNRKLREFRAILAGYDVDGLPDSIELPPETGDTFAVNALAKARVAAAATGRAAIADDSGIVAAALNGRPGVRSARYAGDDATDDANLGKLIEELSREGDRHVAYVCALAYVSPLGQEHVFEGRCEGELILERRGADGFGYDPSFVPDATGPEDSRTMAELSPEQKDAISHRGIAARKLVAWLGTTR